MIQVEFSPESIDSPDYEQRHHPSPMLQGRMETLYLKSGHTPLGDLLYLPDIKDHFVAYLTQYRDGGTGAVVVISQSRGVRLNMDDSFRSLQCGLNEEHRQGKSPDLPDPHPA